MIFEIIAEISGNNAKLETRLIGDYTTAELKTLDKLLDYAIIKSTDSETRKKDNWVKDDKGLFAGSVPYASRIKLAKGEYKKITSEISTNYSKYAGKKHGVHHSLWRDKYYTYEFVNNGFGNYEFVRKKRG